ncbi:haloacid dehalogenase, type II [Aspergillus undulatus]|uniref:haloacid dehalogenase, type II n=1 Tax=Aspergillus undulatus TaxID=1810928 RepID=UPI003CCD3AEB
MAISGDTEALFFDVFGTTVSWRECVTKALEEASKRALQDTRESLHADLRATASAMTTDNWHSMAEDWRASYGRFTKTFDTSNGFISVDKHHYDALIEILRSRCLDGLFTEAELQELVHAWHRLDPWTDSVQGLELLSSKFRTVTLSNGNVSLLEDLAQYGSLPFTDIVSAEHFGAYKPSPRVYLGAAERLGFKPEQCTLVASHLGDLKAAKACGFGTIYVERVGEEFGSLEQALQDGYVDLAVDMEDSKDGFLVTEFQQDKPSIYKLADKDGHFRRKDSVFRSWISRAPDAEFPPEKDRYVLYLNYGCPWAHRTNLVRSLKGLEDVIQLVVCDFELGPEGWFFSGLNGSAEKDPLYGFTKMSQLYFKADPGYVGRYTIPVLWDRKRETIVNNESSEIIRMFYTEFDDLLPAEKREVNKPGGGLYPVHLREKIDALNGWVYDRINNGVYKTGFATTQEAYEASLYLLFEALDRVEEHLAQPAHQPYLFGEYITEADVRLYTTIARFDVAYYLIFKCNLKMIRHDYPLIDKWYRRLYYDESERTGGGAFKKTTFFDLYKFGYLVSLGKKQGIGSSQLVIPSGPKPSILPKEA